MTGNFHRLEPFRLAGSPYDRGRVQACLPGVEPDGVRAIFEARYEAARSVLEAPAARAYLARQTDFASRHCVPELDELAGLCEGFGMALDRLFALMHLSMLSGVFEVDGCTAWARRLPGGGSILCKNRDLSGPHRKGQAAFLHESVELPGARMFCLGTLGAPGAYSSGINGAGLALADTAIQAPRHGIGWLRYFLMTRLLATCATVGDALALIGDLRHAGGGSLILADAAGETAAVELHADGVRIERGDTVFRTNHFWSESAPIVERRIGPAAWRSTSGRRQALEQALTAGLGLGDFEGIAAVMADHGCEGREAICRHGGEDGSHTVSCVVYRPRERSITLSRSAPCAGVWEATTLPQGQGSAR